MVPNLPQVDVFAVPEPRYGRYLSKDWSLRWPLFRARLAIEDGPDFLKAQIVDSESGELIAEAPYNGQGGIRLCSDSSRHYVVIARKGEVNAVLGIGFVDHNQSFDFSLVLQSFARRKAAEQRMDSSWSSRLVASRASSDTTSSPLAPALAPPPGSSNRWSKFDSDSSSEDEAVVENKPDDGEDDFGDFQS
ncbi:Adaptin ear-binding coat-associated protein 1 [Wickerhamiella sorbophila]|uniref:Adaptin ear-binding coat-associated protein 1 n=1 Tax=Wickerhamiella sorbophila TaxID=45607 RepID=A0A2T0FER2_9ASCO|nr:Adaptin ear-binding coat-associated protein 1 [Wickerhamiella sorbophila]PRT53460.1 Adaptin ear-binding coat-associated protein 1 [Wickerhamiella sorbophila]